jgi:ubiquitin carboxyl-terminal hydrolase 14
MYTKSSKITRLPYYIALNFVRFQWKSSEAVRAKILKRVKFPLDLDMAPFCSQELVDKMKPARDLIKQLDDAKLEQKVISLDYQFSFC